MIVRASVCPAFPEWMCVCAVSRSSRKRAIRLGSRGRARPRENPAESSGRSSRLESSRAARRRPVRPRRAAAAAPARAAAPPTTGEKTIGDRTGTAPAAFPRVSVCFLQRQETVADETNRSAHPACIKPSQPTRHNHNEKILGPQDTAGSARASLRRKSRLRGQFTTDYSEKDAQCTGDLNDYAQSEGARAPSDRARVSGHLSPPLAHEPLCSGDGWSGWEYSRQGERAMACSKRCTSKQAAKQQQQQRSSRAVGDDAAATRTHACGGGERCGSRRRQQAAAARTCSS